MPKTGTSRKNYRGDVTTIRCAHGNTVLYPLANIEMKVDDQVIQVEAAVSATLPVPVLLGGDVPELKQLLGSNTQSYSANSEDVVVVVTHAQAKRQLEEEIIQREREVLSGAKPNSVEDLEECSDQEGNQDASHLEDMGQIPQTLTQEQRRAIQQKVGELLETAARSSTSESVLPHSQNSQHQNS